MKKDSKPEFIHYEDKGCKLAPSCLNCPFPRCIQDEWRGTSRLLKQQRNQKIVKAYESGKDISALAEGFGVNLRTIQRALKGGDV